MFKKMIGTMLQNRRRRQNPNCQHHPIRLSLQNTAAESVIKKLIKNDFEAYLVGGAVRDLLMGNQPKDFDVATNATPEQVRELFRRSRIIGKRFPIVHVMVGSETIEVTTFRSGKKIRQNEHGRIMKDNAYGTIEQDALRRDFTCNALYYDIIGHHVIDYHNGLQDIKNKKLVIIGDAAERYQEDPIRILRAVRLSGKLGFTVENATADVMPQYAHLLKHEPVARLFDEVMKLLFSGHARQCLQKLQQLRIHEPIHPLLSALQNASDEHDMVALSLCRTDERLQKGLSVSFGFVLAALLWSNVSALWRENIKQGQSSVAAMLSAVNQAREELEQGWGVPQRYTATMREIWQLQPQFEQRRGNRPFRLLAQPRFRAAYDFLLIRAEFHDADAELASWWTNFQHANETQRQQMVEAQTAQPDAKKRRKPRRKPKIE